MIELYNALKIITLLFFIQKILTFNLGVAFLKSVSICGALSFLLDNIYIRFGTRLYRQIVGIPMGTNCAPLVSDLFLFYYERDFMKNLSSDNQADVIKAFNLTSRYLDDLHQGLSEPELYGDLVHKFKKIRGMTDFSDQFRKKYNALQTYWL